MVQKSIHHHKFLRLFIYGYSLLTQKKTHNVSVFEKNMEFSLRVGDMSFFLFCRFEIVIFKIVQVMTENIPFAFLYVLSILPDGFMT